MRPPTGKMCPASWKSSSSGASPVLRVLAAPACVWAAKPGSPSCVIAELGPISPTASTRTGSIGPRDAICARQRRRHRRAMLFDQRSGAGDPGVVVALPSGPGMRSVDWRRGVQRLCRRRADDALGQLRDVTHRDQCVVEGAQFRIEQDVALREVGIRVDGGDPRRSIRVVQRGRIESGRRFDASPVGLATHELMQVEPEVVLKHERRRPRLRLSNRSVCQNRENRENLSHLWNLWNLLEPLEPRLSLVLQHVQSRIPVARRRSTRPS